MLPQTFRAVCSCTIMLMGEINANLSNFGCTRCQDEAGVPGTITIGMERFFVYQLAAIGNQCSPQLIYWQTSIQPSPHPILSRIL